MRKPVILITGASSSMGKESDLALIKQGETFRAELHYRGIEVPMDQIQQAVQKAREAYNQAVAKANHVGQLAAAVAGGRTWPRPAAAIPPASRMPSVSWTSG